MQDILGIDSVLKDFYTISGIRISIHDTEFNEIYSYPSEPTTFCKCIQENASVKFDCQKNDIAAFTKARDTGEVYVYKCRRGLYEAVAPLYHFGTLSGYIMMGQICDKTPESQDYLLKTATAILGDSSKAFKICKTVKSIDRNAISSYINIMVVLAEYLTRNSKLFNHNEKLPEMVREYINHNYASKITLRDLSVKFECCNATLTKTFKKEFGITIMGYLGKLRLSKAEEMMVQTRRTIKEISAECGFSDQNYFSKTFATEFGCSPSAYREQYAAIGKRHTQPL